MPAHPDPFELLAAAHREIEARVAELERATEELGDEARRARALEVIAAVLDYFEGPAAVHHADEEETLFPHLRSLATFSQMLSAFDFQHQMNADGYAKLRAAFGAYQPGAESQLRQVAHHFAELQRAHILAEERSLFPQAARALSSAAIEQIARAMAARRSAGSK